MCNAKCITHINKFLLKWCKGLEYLRLSSVDFLRDFGRNSSLIRVDEILQIDRLLTHVQSANVPPVADITMIKSCIC